MIQQLVVNNLKVLLKTCPIKKIQILNNNIVLTVKSAIIVDLLLFLKYHINCQFNILTCISGVDYPKNKHRFLLVYELLSTKYNIRLRIKTFTNELIGINSCNKLYFNSTWYESEIWDMFGVFFKNHPDLKKILTDYGFEGYPLRKDFPLIGFVETRYNEIQKEVLNDSIKLNQESRTFCFLSPWEINNTTKN